MAKEKDLNKGEMTPPPVPVAGNFIAWHHIRATVPHDWEVTKNSVEDRVGRIEFGTRVGLKATVSWEPCLREPNRLTTMKTFIQNNIYKKDKNKNVDDVKTTDVGNFLVGWMDDQMVPCQALGYNAETQHLVRWIFEGDRSETYREEVIFPILNSCSYNDSPEEREYSLYGIHCSLPLDYKIEDMVTLPANAMMLFEGEESHRRVTFRRWGMASMILGKKDLFDFYNSVLRTLNIQAELVSKCTVNGLDGRILKYSALREHHSDRYMRRRWHNGEAIIWYNKEENRIYTFEQIGPEKSKPLEFSSVFKGYILRRSK
jgi:hypothetical protein